jgi:hypothetical protein
MSPPRECFRAEELRGVASASLIRLSTVTAARSALLKTQGKEQNIGEKPITVANVDQLKLASRKTDTGHALEVWTTVGKATKMVLFREWDAAGTSIYIVSTSGADEYLRNRAPQETSAPAGGCKKKRYFVTAITFFK